ncbi:MAG: DUF3473 domain-containing protein [Planctomycetales bacterium]|nr:DUF3473 domain-containing protein [Planctomycetales bacterium]
MNPLNAFTVDVEDYFQVSAFERDIRRSAWPDFESRVERNTQRLLELLERFDVKATFFILGWIAEKLPSLVASIHAAGHEIGSHSYWHRLIYEQTPEEFREDLRRSKQALEAVTGAAVRIYRAPSFSITSASAWALDVLAEEGFTIDSSIFPVRHDRYGIRDANYQPHELKTQSGSLWEAPPTVFRCCGMHVPVAGGGYFRLYPLSVTRYCLRHVNRTENRPVIFYVHPWEIDPDQPRLQAGSRLTRARHYVNLSKTEYKLEQLLRMFRFGRLGEVVEQCATGAIAAA